MSLTFRTYLEQRGSSDGTVSVYMSHVKELEESKDPIATAVSALTDRSRAPLTRRLALAAFRSWVRFFYASDDEACEQALKRLKQVKLPPKERKRPQVPLPDDVYQAVRKEIDRAKYLSDPMRAELGIMANRGIRRGDVLRLRRAEVTSALKNGRLSYEAKGGRRLEFGVSSHYKPYLEMLADQKTWGQVHELLAPSWETAGVYVNRALTELAEVLEERGDLGTTVEVVDVRPHILRRTYAVTMYKAFGYDLMRLKNHMQWASIEVASSYVDFADREELDEIAEKAMARRPP